jgi:hypothetical protein
MGRNLFEETPIQPQVAGVNLFADQPVQVDQQANQPESYVPREAEPETPSLLEGGSQSLIQGATMGFSDEIQSVIAAAVASPFIEDKTFGQIMVDARKSFRDDNERFKEENPKTALGLELAGSLSSGGAGLFKNVAGQTLKQATAKGAVSGLGIGTAAGAGFADEKDFFSQETFEEAIKTGTISGFLGGLTPSIIKGAVTAGKLIPKAMPESLLQTVMKFRPSIDQKARDRMTRTALDEGIMPTVAGTQKISNSLFSLDTKLNAIIDTATKSGKLIPKKALFTELQSLRKEFGRLNIRGGKNLKQINKIASDFDKQLRAIDKNKLTPREVQDFKRNAYQQLTFDASQQSGQFAQMEAEKGIIRGARQSLEAIDPDVQRINRREGDLLQLGDELERVVGRLDNRNLISIDTAVKIGAGTAGGPVGTAVGTTAAVLGSPRVKARTALILENIRTLSETMNGAKGLSPELLKPISILIEDQKQLLNEMIND